MALLAGTFMVWGCGSKPQNAPTPLSVPTLTQSSEMLTIDLNYGTNTKAVFQLNAETSQQTVQALKEDVANFNGFLKLEGGVNITFDVSANAGGARVAFVNLPIGTHRLYVAAKDRTGALVNKNNDENGYDYVGDIAVSKANLNQSIVVGPFQVPLKESEVVRDDGGSVDLEAVQGILQRVPRTSSAANETKVATIGDYLDPNFDTGTHLDLSGEIDATLANQYSAFLDTGASTPQYIGRVSFSWMSPWGAGNALAAELYDTNGSYLGGVYFILDSNNILRSAIRDGGANYWRVDPEAVQDESFPCIAFPEGVLSKHYYMLDPNRNILDLYIDSVHQGIAGAVFPISMVPAALRAGMPDNAVIHLQRINP